MRFFQARAFIAAVVLTLAIAYGCAGVPGDRPLVWPTYQHDGNRSGQNEESDEIGNPGTIGAVWIFPRISEGVSENVTIVDDKSPLCRVTRGWGDRFIASDSYESHFWHAKAVGVKPDDTLTGTPARAEWEMPTILPRGTYQIYVWVPSNYTGVLPRPRNAPRVKYQVYDDRGVTDVIFDQSDGGAWKLLSPRFFQFASAAGAYKVVVTTETDLTEREIADHNYIVAADAVKFVPATGQEIFSSPTSAIMHYDASRDPVNPVNWQGDAPFVFVGTVDPPLTHEPGASDLGSVYCINSVTPFAGNNFGSDPRWAMLAEKLGTPLWKYPDTNLGDRDECEGPIEGGVYSSPTIVKVGASDKLICYVAGMDRQVYALDAENGNLLWKGPGITATERDKDDPGWLSWKTEETADAFGGEYRWTGCIAPAATGLRVVTWDFTGMLSDTGAPSEEQNGLSYAVYAWLPTTDPDEPIRCRDAVYTITYQDGAATANITVDQDLPDSQGKWVKLGSSYFNVQSVTLKNTTNQPEPGNFCIAVDALMIVPDTIEAFGYSTPVANTNGDTVFAATSEGRIVSFFAEPFAAYDKNAPYAGIGKMRWIYPQVRTKLEGSVDQDPLGEMGASPAFAGDRLYVASFEGKVHSLTGLSNDFTTSADQDWVFPNGAVDTKENVVGFTSSPTLYPAGKQLFIGSTGGVFYCLQMDKQEDSDGNPISQLIWRYPADPAGPVDPTDPDQGMPMPLGAFRFSTPTVARLGTAVHPRVWCGSSDGKVYSFDTAPGVTDRRIWVEFNEDGSLKAQHGPAGVWYFEPQVGAPIQGSIAFDGGASGGAPTMFVGDMAGTLHWYVSRTGDNTNPAWDYKGWRTEGELFSSPNVTDTPAGAGRASWIYVGASDGRLYAFSDEGGAWNGDWHGGIWPFEGDPNEGRAETAAGPATEIQFDIFPADFAHATERLDPEPKIGGNYVEPTWPDDPAIADDPSDSGDPSTLGKTMKIMPEATVNALPAHDPADPTKRDKAIDTYLLGEAKKRRNYAFEGANRAKSVPLYFEWGETIYIALWNLPERKLLSGSSDSDKRNSIRFTMSNTSAGENAGSQIRLTGNIKFLKEYTVVDGSTATGTSPVLYDALIYTGTTSPTEVKRCYALGQVEIRSTSSRPPSPGPGWILTANIIAKEREKGPDESLILPLAKLKNSTVTGVSFEPVLVDSNNDTVPDTYTEQLVGINNPLAIRDDGDRIGTSKIDLAWPDLTTGANAFTTYNARNDPEAHYNGNAVANTASTQLATGIIPTLNLKLFGHGALGTGRGVPHGTSSREGWLGVMDRSATGCSITNNSTIPPTTATISRFRINARDLRWRGDVGAISTSGGIQFPWDQGPGSVDYPHIFQRSQSFRKASDDNDPAVNSASLPALILRQKGAGWDTDYGINQDTCPVMRPDTVFVSVDVPRFQPANDRDGASPTRGSKYDVSGYSRTAQAYIDSDGNREFGSGNSIRGRPSTYQEAYREFKTWLTVPPDPRIEVEEQTIDIGRAPHGLGEALEGTLDSNGLPLWFHAYNANPLIRQWFKKLTVKNAGNVNLYNLRIARWIVDQAGTAYDLGLISDQVNPTAPLPATTIVSSLDGNIPVFSADPFATNSASGFGTLGYTLSKARVGDPDPTILTIPDRRKWDINYDRARDSAQAALRDFRWPFNQPLAPYVSVQVPLTQPMGTYMSFNPLFRDYTIPVFGDVSGDGKLQAGEPFAAPSFHLKITVREAQLTGGLTPTTLPQIDSPADVDPMPRVGDATPAAFKDAETGNVYLFWSSNRMFDPANYPDWTGSSANADAELADFASAPWFIDRAMLEWDASAAKKGWLPVTATPGGVAQRWWKPPSSNPYLPDAQWPDLTNVMPWTIGGRDTGLYQVRHYSPVIAENLWTGASANQDLTWLAWAGSADRLDPATNKIQRDYMLFYTDATHGDVTSEDRPVYTIVQTPGAPGHDPSAEKRYPSLSVFDKDMWMFWQGGQKGAWSILFATQRDASGKHDPAVSPWTQDTRLRTPDCLASVSSPNAIFRHYWVDYTGDTPVSSNSRNLFDVVYSGTSKLRQNSDILLGKYIAVTQQEQVGSRYSPDVLPGRAAVRLPRQFGEKLARDPRFGFFTSRHLAWARLEASKLARREQRPVFDNWGGYDPSDPTADPDLPYIHVVLPAGYEDDSGRVWKSGAVISATDGSISTPDGDEAAPEPILPVIDEATGVYTYKYPQAATAAVLGDMLVDFSEGIVRFTKPLVERANADGSISAPEIFADYTPQTWRLTTDLAADSSPRAFIERTDLNQFVRGPDGSQTPVTPGLCSWKGKQAPVDRLWVFWRKAGTGIESSTIFYRTFRIAVDLMELPYVGSSDPALPVRMNPDGTPTNPVTVTGNLGPYEVDRTGRIIWFTQTDERYRSMFTPELSLPPTTNPYFGPGPGPITIKYTATDGEEHEVKAEDIFWRTELAEQSLFGFAADSNVNEGSIYAFADPKPTYKSSQAGTFAPLPTSKIWVFWTSTRGGTSDLFWETLSPNFSAK